MSRSSHVRSMMAYLLTSSIRSRTVKRRGRRISGHFQIHRGFCRIRDNNCKSRRVITFRSGCRREISVHIGNIIKTILDSMCKWDNKIKEASVDKM